MLPTNPFAMKPEQEAIAALKKSLQLIEELSFEMCRHEDDAVEDNSRHINSLAHESYKLLDRRESTLRAKEQNL
jgi:hypothetical protein